MISYWYKIKFYHHSSNIDNAKEVILDLEHDFSSLDPESQREETFSAKQEGNTFIELQSQILCFTSFKLVMKSKYSS